MYYEIYYSALASEMEAKENLIFMKNQYHILEVLKKWPSIRGQYKHLLVSDYYILEYIMYFKEYELTSSLTDQLIIYKYLCHRPSEISRFINRISDSEISVCMAVKWPDYRKYLISNIKRNKDILKWLKYFPDDKNLLGGVYE